MGRRKNKGERKGRSRGVMGEEGGVVWGEDGVGGKNRWLARKKGKEAIWHPPKLWVFVFWIFKPWLAVMGLIYSDSGTAPGKPPILIQNLLKGLQRGTEGRRVIRMGGEIRKFGHVKVEDEGKNE